MITAMVTPFTADNGLDLPRAAELADKLIAEGSDGLVVCGTTGESPTVFYDQKIELFKTVIDAVGGRVPIIANAGDNCTDDSVDFARKVVSLGVDAIMAVVPYYNKPPQEGLYPPLLHHRERCRRPGHPLQHPGSLRDQRRAGNDPARSPTTAPTSSPSSRPTPTCRRQRRSSRVRRRASRSSPATTSSRCR